MKVYEVLIEYTSSNLDRLFSYFYEKDDPIQLLSRVIVPFNNKLVCGVVININQVNETKEEYIKKTGFEIKNISSVIDKEPLLNEELANLSLEIANYYFAPRISVFFSMLPPSLKPKLSSQNKPKIAYESFVKVIDNNIDNLTKKQIDLLNKISTQQTIKKSECPTSILSSLIQKNKVEIFKKEKNRMFFETIEKTEKLTLNEEQKECFDKILNGTKDTYLLEGVTGSGKTEVYLQVAEEIIKKQKTVLMLVPEISLSYLMVKRFMQRFERVAILHSKLTPSQRYDEYRRIKHGQVDIVIGARSAVFAPLENIGLVILDEEHSETYKQEDQLPYYHALDVIKMRQKYHNFKIILGSATPSLETKSRALKGIYEQLYLKKRINNLPLPKVDIVDLTNKNNISSESALLSNSLIEAIKNRLTNHQQSILLVNRRGHSPYVSCRECGYVIKCPNCQVALTYHYMNNKLICHHCNYEVDMITKCPKCNSNKVFKGGFGTEKIELEIKKIFPDARVLRLDSDITRKVNLTNKIINDFANNEADILIGTQIIAKGHDFENVTLVGIVLADIGLAIPSFRANERTFNLITQAIGRSGRAKKGEAIVQTYNKNNFVIKTACRQDYMSFYATEIKLRKLLNNPPYTFMCLLLISGKKYDEVEDASDEVKRYLQTKFNEIENVFIVGPSEMFIKKLNDLYRKKIILKYKDYNIVKPVINDLMLFFAKKRNLSLIINVNPHEDY